ncbi:unnamed protein product [Lymnaea stagnalis]|uniref:Carboxylesterase type B domain-containing protein n=1 Tax=Lymnaea stagnalis TaxID=6523 RepID=A0AAV2I576_LYMST
MGTHVMLLLVTASVQLWAAYPSPVVDTPFGRLRGMETVARNNKTYLAFLGIPYAKPPVGELRFNKPVPHPKLAAVFNATVPGASCVQSDLMLQPGETMSEDCLFLNVFTRGDGNSTVNRKKVMVWVHGGAFILGSSLLYDAGSIVTDHDVIVVTLNYRLGVLGFFSTGNEASLGNYGLWDQVAALEWVKDNIAGFGGDPDDVTAMGQSAGGASVSLLALSPVAKGVFTRVYAQSGFASSLFANYVNSYMDAEFVSRELNCTNEVPRNATELVRSHAVLDCLRNRSAADVSKWAAPELYRTSYGPRVDGDLIPRSALELLGDYDYLVSIGFYERAYLVGVNNNDRQAVDALFESAKLSHYGAVNNLTSEEKEKGWKDTVNTAACFNIGDRLGLESPSDVQVRPITDWYENRHPGEAAVKTLISDLYFSVPLFDFLKAVARNSSVKAWLMYFNHFPSYLNGTSKGMTHGLDLPYLFDIPMDVVDRLTFAGIHGSFDGADLRLRRLFSSLIAEFTKTGNPTKALDSETPGGWPAYDLQGGQYLDFNPTPSIQQDLDREKREFWEVTAPSWFASTTVSVTAATSTTRKGSTASAVGAVGCLHICGVVVAAVLINN